VYTCRLRIVVEDGNATVRFQCFDQLLYGLSIVNFNRLVCIFLYLLGYGAIV